MKPDRRPESVKHIFNFEVFKLSSHRAVFKRNNYTRISSYQPAINVNNFAPESIYAEIFKQKKIEKSKRKKENVNKHHLDVFIRLKNVEKKYVYTIRYIFY